MEGVNFSVTGLNVEGTQTSPATIDCSTFEKALQCVESLYFPDSSIPESFLTDEPVMSNLNVSTLSTDTIPYDSYKGGIVIEFDLAYTGDEQSRFEFVDQSFIFRLRLTSIDGSPGAPRKSGHFIFTLRPSEYDNLPVGVSVYKTLDTVSRVYHFSVYLNSSYLLTEFEKDDLESIRLDCFLPSHIGGNWSNPNFCDTVRDGNLLFTLDPHFYYQENSYVDIDELNCPFYGSKFDEPESRLKISALPFRAYESIYNCFYRDSRNNPLMLDGQPEYNKWLLTVEGGCDQTPYTLRYRNWEPDFLTTAVQSPQQGVAPLVGITTRGDMRFQDQETGQVYTAKANLAEDGQSIESFTVMTPTMPEGNLLALGDMVTSGISISDFRNVNALQVWLETNMRKGMTFKDLIKGHFNVDVRFDELDMPEFIGGVSRSVQVHSVTQTSSDVEGSPLGSYAGQASLVGASGDSITHYCDEPGYIIGILSITPTPAYSQLLPKHFIKRNTLDYFSPEFGHVGFVPIKMKEVCPVQAFSMGIDRLNDTFGYQRAWYDYLASTDEIHGLFRTSLRNYLMTRTFYLPPDLSESFLLVDPGQLNEVFASTTENDDKILGQIYYDVSVKRPIPRYGVPRLE